MYLIAIDIGNSNIKIAVTKGRNVIKFFKLPTKAQDIQTVFRSLIATTSFNIEGAIISSVVPTILEPVKNEIINILNIHPHIVKYLPELLKVKVLIDNPETLGADRIAALEGAFKFYGNNLLIVDMGTATTFDIINDNGEYIGGLIAPGIEALRDAMCNSAFLLPSVEIIKLSDIIATSTIPAMQSGIYFGYCAMVEGITQEIFKSYQKPLKIILTGGTANLFESNKIKFDVKDPELIIKGLIEIYKNNN